MYRLLVGTYETSFKKGFEKLPRKYHITVIISVEGIFSAPWTAPGIQPFGIIAVIVGIVDLLLLFSSCGLKAGHTR